MPETGARMKHRAQVGGGVMPETGARMKHR
jgi:hypothetical protein